MTMFLDSILMDITKSSLGLVVTDELVETILLSKVASQEDQPLVATTTYCASQVVTPQFEKLPTLEPKSIQVPKWAFRAKMTEEELQECQKEIALLLQHSKNEHERNLRWLQEDDFFESINEEHEPTTPPRNKLQTRSERMRAELLKSRSARPKTADSKKTFAQSRKSLESQISKPVSSARKSVKVKHVLFSRERK